MNRTVANSQNSEVGDIEQGGVAVRPHASGDDSSGKSTRQKKQSSGKDASKKSGKGKDGGSSGNVGNLLRGAYRQAVDEAIPDDLMDLLNRLE